MFKETYKAANERIKISETAKILALDKINGGGRHVKYSYLVAVPIAAIVLVAALTLLPKGLFSSLPKSGEVPYSEGVGEGAAAADGAMNDGGAQVQAAPSAAPKMAAFDDTAENVPVNISLLAAPVFPDPAPEAASGGRTVLKGDNTDAVLSSVQSFSYNSASRVLAQTSAENQVYSPTSAYMAVAMLTAGAVDETQRELLNVLAVEDLTSLEIGSSKLFASLRYTTAEGQLSPANSIWFNSNIAVKQAALDGLSTNHCASVFGVDFTKKETSEAISAWVSENTGGKLGTNPDAFTFKSNTVMTLFNTLYFNDEWSSGFNAEQTKPAKFALLDKSNVEVDYMHANSVDSYIDAPMSVSYSRYFKSGNKMTFILPKEDVFLTDIVSVPANIEQALDVENRKSAQIDFKLPKFNFSNKKELKTVLQDMGVKQAFEFKVGNFGGFTDAECSVSEVLQEATISIDEKGCEAAAYTEVILLGNGLPPEKLEQRDIHLNKPFAFVITDRSDVPLFIGTVNNPTLS